MYAKMNYNSPSIELPQECLFPKTAESLILQAKAFTGKEIVMDPHWRAAPSLWLDSDGTDSYREWLKAVQKEKNRTLAAFVFHRSDWGAYIVYADHGNRWDGSLCSGRAEHDDKVESLCHEIGHLMTAINAPNLPEKEGRYYNEQCAIIAENILKTAIRNRGRIYREFPKLKTFQPTYVQETMDYDTFCIYTPSPLARYYESDRGRLEGVSRYLSPSGIIRFDLAADDITKTALHLRYHLSTMKIFGGIALHLAQDNNYADYIAQSLSGHDLKIRTTRCEAPDQYAATILKHWWKVAQDTLGEPGPELLRNIYIGEQDPIPSFDQAKGYFLNLITICQRALTRRPYDHMLGAVYQGLNATMLNPGTLPDITSKITAHCEDNNQPQRSSNVHSESKWGWLRNRRHG